MVSLETKIVLFYLSLDEMEKTKFLSLLNYENLRGNISKNELMRLKNQLNDIDNLIGSKRFSSKPEQPASADFDIAVMQVVRYIVNMSESNLDLAKYIEEIFAQRISRPDKRSKYELQGMLLGALMDAPKQKLRDIKNKIMFKTAVNKGGRESKTNLDKWFSIILGK